MTTTLKVSLPILLAFTSQFIFHFGCWSADKETTKAALENYSITVGADAQRKHRIGENICTETWSAPIGLLYPLKKPKQNNVVAVLEVEPNGEYTLNPAGLANYGPIPALSSLTVSEANQLWGHTSNSDVRNSFEPSTKKTYDLGFARSDKNSVQLDLVFKHNLLQSYRVRTKDIVPLSSAWRLVK